MEIGLKALLGLLIGYVVGNFSTGILVSKLYGKIDIRQYGSGGTGMSNVMRTLGWAPSVLTLLGDVLKGILGAQIGQWIGGEYGMFAGALGAIVGHNWPVLFHFHGGKGMSTSLGAIFVIDWRIALILIAVQLVIVLTSGYMSIASIFSCLLFMTLSIVWHSDSWAAIVFGIVAAALGIFSHRANIARLIRGEENQLNIRKITEVSKKYDPRS